MKYLESKEGIAGGQLVLKGTRIKIALILQYVSEGHTLTEMHKWYPHISERKLSGAIAEASTIIATTSHAKIVL